MANSDAMIAARKRYEKKRLIKNVSFNLEKEKDLVDFIDSEIDNFSNWVKNAVRKKMAEK